MTPNLHSGAVRNSMSDDQESLAQLHRARDGQDSESQPDDQPRQFGTGNNERIAVVDGILQIVRT